MNLPTFLMFLLISCGFASKLVRLDKVTDEGGNAKALYDPGMSGEATQQNANRQSRAFSPFSQAWKSLVKTTLGFTTDRRGARIVKIYIEVGTKADAIADFKSLRPTTIKQLPNEGFIGYVGNQQAIALKDGIYVCCRHSRSHVQ